MPQISKLLRVTLNTVPRSGSQSMSSRPATATDHELPPLLLRALLPKPLRLPAGVVHVLGRNAVAGEKSQFVVGEIDHERARAGFRIGTLPWGPLQWNA